METGELSLHRLKVYRFVRDSGASWLSNHEIAVGCGVAERTARAHTKSLVSLGVFDQAEVFPGRRYRVSAQAEKRNKAYLLRLDHAEEVFGLTTKQEQGKKR